MMTLTGGGFRYRRPIALMNTRLSYMNEYTIHRDHAQITTTELVVFGLGNPSTSVPRYTHGRVSSPMRYTIAVIAAHVGGPMGRGMKQPSLMNISMG